MGKRIVLGLILCASLANALFLAVVIAHQGKISNMIVTMQGEIDKVNVSLAETHAYSAQNVSNDGSDQAAATLPVDNGAYVYIATQSGKKYHISEDCRGLRNAQSVERVPMDELTASMERCKICYAE